LDNLQVAGLDFVNEGNGVINIDDADDAALLIQSITSAGAVADSYINLNTTLKSIVLGDGVADLLDIDTATIDLVTPGAATMKLAQNANALKIHDNRTGVGLPVDAIRCDTSAATPHVYFEGNVTVEGSLNTPGGTSGGTTYSGTLTIETPDVIDTSNQASNFIIKDNDGASLRFRDDGSSGAAATYLAFNTVDASEAVVVGEAGAGGPGSLHLRVPTIDVSTQATDFIIKQVEANALVFKNAVDGDVYMTLDTSSGTERILLGDVGGATFGPRQLDINIGIINTDSQPTIFDVHEDHLRALDFQNSSGTFMILNTTNDRVEFGNPISGASGGTLTVADDLIVSGASISNDAITVASDPGHIRLTNGSQYRTETFSGAPVPLIVMGASDQIAIGAETLVTGVELRCSTDNFLVQYNDGNKAIWHDDLATMTTDASAVSWGLHTSSATALQIKDGGTPMMTFDTAVPFVYVHVPLSITGASAVNGILTVGGSAVSGAEGGQIHLTSAPTGGFTGTVALDTRAKQVRIFGTGTALDAGAEFLFMTAGGDAVITGEAGTLWGDNKDGPGSGLNADMLDGAHLADIMTSVLGTRTGTPYQNNIGRLLLDDGTLLVQWGWTTEIVSNSLTVPVTASYTYPVAFGATPYLMVVPYTWYSVPTVFQKNRTYAFYSTLDPQDSAGYATYSSTDTVLTWRVKRLSQLPSAFDITWDSCPFIAIGAPA